MFRFTEGIPRDNFDNIDFVLGFEGQEGLIETNKTMEVTSSSFMGIDVAFLVIEGAITFPGMDSISVIFYFFFDIFIIFSNFCFLGHSRSWHFWWSTKIHFFWKSPSVI